MSALWLPLAIVAGGLQIVRNAAQRGLSDTAGPWGATLVRFLFGLPFAVAFLIAVTLVAPPIAPKFAADFWLVAMLGATAQVCATAALIQAMRASTFGLGSTFQHVSLPLAAAFGALVLGDKLSFVAWGGILIATSGLLVASWPKAKPGETISLSPKAFAAGFYGLASGACFAVSANCFRYCGQAVDPQAVFFSSSVTLVVVQALQSIGLGGLLYTFDRGALRALRADLRASSVAGLTGAAASACWFAALALAPAALIRAVNAVVEAPAATLMGWVRFKEPMDMRRGAGSAMIVAGVVLLVLNWQPS